MATSSTIPAVKAALVERLTAAVNDSGVQIVWGRPQDSLAARECVYVADARPSYEFANIKAGRRQYDERFEIDVLFCVARARGDVQAAAERAYQLLAALRDVLADDFTVGGISGLVWLRMGSAVEAVAYGGEGPVAIIETTVSGLARLV